ncbi:MAG: C-GCAxxG-C-C family protein [Deltaproteobacteria bacterium]|jgi:hypothetical protein|nr:C-GCAxxG-C-C family protein [Deltaproteobacteria bacterium]
MKQYSRRNVLGLMGGVMAGGAIAGMVAPALAAAPKPADRAGNLGERFKQTGGDFSWKPQKLDPIEVATVAHAGFWHQGYGCGYGVLYSIVGLMGEKYGAPYKDFPFSMMEFGKSGISEWGGTCGALLGAAAALALFFPRKDRDAMIDELFRWYELAAFPIYKPNPGTTKVEGPLPSSVANSIICHISVAKWCAASKFDARSTERSERCARITADVALKTLEIIQAQADGKFKPAPLAKSEVFAGCTVQGCHGENKKDWQHAGLKGRMDCTPCHTGSNAVQDKRKNHPG